MIQAIVYKRPSIYSLLLMFLPAYFLQTFWIFSKRMKMPDFQQEYPDIRQGVGSWNWRWDFVCYFTANKHSAGVDKVKGISFLTNTKKIKLPLLAEK